MRRSRAHELHPRLRDGAAASNLYIDPMQNVTRTDDPDSFFHNMAESPSPSLSRGTVSIWNFEDATDIDTTDKWKPLKSDESLAPAILNKRGGGVGLAVGNVSGKSYSYLERRNQNIEIDSASELWIEFEVKAYDPSTISVAAIQIGISDGATPGNVDDPDFDPNNPLGFTNAVYVDIFQTGRDEFYVGANTKIQVYSAGSLVEDDTIAHSDNEDDHQFTLSVGYRRIGMHIYPDVAGTHAIEVFDGETRVATVSGYSLPSDSMGVFFGSYSHNDRVIVRKVQLIQGQDDQNKSGLDLD